MPGGQGENVGAIYVDVSANIGDALEALGNFEKKLESLTQGTYTVKLNAANQQQQSGNQQNFAIEAVFQQGWETKLAKQLVNAELRAPVSLFVTAGAIADLKRSILQGMAGFAVPINLSGVAGGQPGPAGGMVQTGGGGPTQTQQVAAQWAARAMARQPAATTPGAPAAGGAKTKVEADRQAVATAEEAAAAEKALDAALKDAADAAAKATASAQRLAELKQKQSEIASRRFRDPATGRFRQPTAAEVDAINREVETADRAAKRSESDMFKRIGRLSEMAATRGLEGTFESKLGPNWRMLVNPLLAPSSTGTGTTRGRTRGSFRQAGAEARTLTGVTAEEISYAPMADLLLGDIDREDATAAGIEEVRNMPRGAIFREGQAARGAERPRQATPRYGQHIAWMPEQRENESAEAYNARLVKWKTAYLLGNLPGQAGGETFRRFVSGEGYGRQPHGPVTQTTPTDLPGGRLAFEENLPPGVEGPGRVRTFPAEDIGRMSRVTPGVSGPYVPDASLSAREERQLQSELTPERVAQLEAQRRRDILSGYSEWVSTGRKGMDRKRVHRKGTVERIQARVEAAFERGKPWSEKQAIRELRSTTRKEGLDLSREEAATILAEGVGGPGTGVARHLLLRPSGEAGLSVHEGGVVPTYGRSYTAEGPDPLGRETPMSARIERAKGRLAELRAARKTAQGTAGGSFLPENKQMGLGWDIPNQQSDDARAGASFGAQAPDTIPNLDEEIRKQKNLIRRLQYAERRETTPTAFEASEAERRLDEQLMAAEPTKDLLTVASGGGGGGRRRGTNAVGGGGEAGAPLTGSSGPIKVFVVNWPSGFGGGRRGEAVQSPTMTLSSADTNLGPEARAQIAEAEAQIAEEKKAAQGLAFPAGAGTPSLARQQSRAATAAAGAAEAAALAQERKEDRQTAAIESRRLKQDQALERAVNSVYDKMMNATEKAAEVKPGTISTLDQAITKAAALQGVAAPRVPQRPDRLTRQDIEARSREAIARAEISGEKAGLPERAPSTALGQIAARATGVKGRFEEAAREEQVQKTILQDFEAQAKTANEIVAREQERFDILKKQSATTAGLDKHLAEQASVLEDAKSQAAELTAETEAQRKEVEKATAARKAAGGGAAQAAQVAGLFVGVKAFLVINQAFDAAMTATAAIMAPLVDEFLGFAETSKKVQTAIRDQTIATRGNVDAAIAATAATAGLSDQAAQFLQVGGGFGRTATAQAGAQAAQQQRDLFRTALGGGGFPTALFRGTGGVFNSSILAEQLGGQQGLGEALAKQFGSSSAQFQGPNEPFRRGPGFFPLRIKGTGLENEAPSAEAIQARATNLEQLKNANAALARQAEYAYESGSAFQFIGKTAEDFDARANEMVEAAAQLGSEAENTAKAMAKAGVAITTAGGQGLSIGDQFGRALEQYGQGLTIQDPTLLIREQQRQFNAEIQGMDERLRLTMQLIPGQFAIALAAQPNLAPSTGISTAGLGGAQTREVNAHLRRLGELQAEDTAEAELGRKNLEELVQRADEARLQAYNVAAPTAEVGVTPGRTRAGAELATESAQVRSRAATGFQPQLPVFQKLFADLQRYGNELAQVQTQLANRQANNAIKDYNQQIILVTRNLNDAKALAGQRADIDRLTVGHLQRQQVLLQRQSQELSFQAQTLQLELQQRRINFQVAVAGFQAPGETSEERRARIEQAKIEADYAQRLLNIQKQQLALGKREFKVSVQIQDRSFLRTIQELQFQLRSLERGRALTVFTAAAERHIAALQRRIAQTNARINAIIETSTGIAQRIIDIGVSVAAATGAAVRKVVQSAYNVLTRALAQFQTLVTQLNRNISVLPLPGRSNETRNAGGALFMTSGETNVGIAGEAGSEAVAIIRNPRPIALGGGGGSSSGGGTTVTIAFNGTVNVRSDDDIKAIAREVEKVFNRRGSLLGMRSLSAVS